MAEGYEPVPPSGWREITPTFPAGTTGTQYTRAFINDAIGLVYISIYVTFPTGLSAAEIIMSGLPSPDVGLNFLAIDFDNSDTFTPRPIYISGNNLRIRGALSAGHAVIGIIIYKI